MMDSPSLGYALKPQDENDENVASTPPMQQLPVHIDSANVPNDYHTAPHFSMMMPEHGANVVINDRNEDPNDVFTRYSKSIVIENVPSGSEDILMMILTDKCNGGGPLDGFLIQNDGLSILATFREKIVAEHFLNAQFGASMKIGKNILKISRPPLVETVEESMAYMVSFSQPKSVASTESEVKISTAGGALSSSSTVKGASNDNRKKEELPAPLATNVTYEKTEKEKSSRPTANTSPVFVSGILPAIEPLVLAILEAPKKDGGKIQVYEYDEALTTAKVIFDSPQVADRLLRKGSFTVEENRITISRYNYVIYVHGVSSAERADLILMMLENPRTGCGPFIHQQLEKNTLTVCFQDKQAFDSALKKGFVTILNDRYMITKNPDSHQFAQAATTNPSAALQSPLEASRATDSSRVSQSPVESVRTTATLCRSPQSPVETSKPTTSSTQTSEASHTKSSGPSKVSPSPTEVSSHDKQNIEVAGILTQLPVDQDVFDTIKITNITPAIKHMVPLYFENERRSGGGDFCEPMRMSEDQRKAFIRFKDPKVALRVCQAKEHVIDDVILKVVARELPVDVESLAVHVTGITEQDSEDFIRLTFENKRTGGGPVEEIFIDNEKRSAVVTFENPRDARNVVTNPLLGKFKTVLMTPRSPPPRIIDEADEWRLLVKHLPEPSTSEKLKQFIEKNSDCKVKNFTRCLKPSTILLEFSQIPDYLQLRRLVSTKPYQGTMISIQRVPKTNKIQVHGFKETTTKQFLELYFDSDRIGAGVVVGVDLNTAERCAVVEFNSSQALSAVLSMSHTLEGQPVEVKPYYPWIGLHSSHHQQAEALCVQIPCSSRTWLFIKCHPQLLKQLQNEVAGLNCRLSDLKVTSEAIDIVVIDNKKVIRDWEGKAKSILQKYTEGLTEKKIQIEFQIWDEFKSKLQEFLVRKKLDVTIDYDDKQHFVSYITWSKVAIEFDVLVDEVKSELQGNLLQCTESIPFEAHKLEILKMSFVLNKLKDIRNMQMELGAESITFTGSKDKVFEAKSSILEHFNHFKSQNLLLSGSVIKSLQDEATKSSLHNLFLAQKLCASLTVSGNSCKIHAIGDDDLSRSVDLITKQVVQQQIPVDGKSRHFIKSKEWNECIKDICSELKGSVIDVADDDSFVTVAGIHNNQAAEKIKAFLATHVVDSKTICMDFPYFDLIRRYRAEDLMKINLQLRSAGGRLDYNKEGEDDCEFKLTGTKLDLSKAINDLHDLAASIQSADHEIDRMSTYFEQRQGKSALTGLEKTYNVSIRIVDSNAQARSGLNTGHTLISKVTIGKGQNILLLDGDITKYKVDAIVNAANKDLRHGGGIAKAISDAAGPEMDLECKNYIADNQPLLPGQVYVSKPGNLPCKYIIHAVGPEWRGGNRREPEHLRTAVYTSLLEASNRMSRTIALPAISTGIFNFPLKMAMEIILSAIEEFMHKNGSSSLKEVHIIDVDQKVLNSFELELNRMGDEHAKAERQEQGPQRQLRRHNVEPSAGDSIATGTFRSMAHDCGQFKTTNDPAVITTADGLRVSLFKGSIVTLNVDGIANTAHHDLDLKHGAVSQSILKAAGNAIQDDCLKGRPQDLKAGELVVTQGHKLPCKKVYHGFLQRWDGGGGKCTQVVRNFLQNILQRATEDKLKSVAIPAVGTGNLNIPHDVVAKIMYDEVAAFSKATPRTTLTDVHFVVFDKDQKSIDAFERQIVDLTSSPTQRDWYRTAAARPSNMTYENGIAQIGTIKLCVKTGDITKVQVDAIVNSTNSNLNLSDGGGVSAAIAKAGGDTVKQECQNGKPDANGIFISSGGNLPSRHIIHLVAGRSDAEWTKVIGHCLVEAEKKQFQHIAFPLLGTGNCNTSPSSMAVIMTKTIDNFCSMYKPSVLKQITVYIYQQQMLSDFTNAIADSTQRSSSVHDDSFDTANSRPSSGAEGRGPSVYLNSELPQRRILQICAFSEQSITKVIEEIHQILDEATLETVLESDQDAASIRILTERQLARIYDLERSSPNIKIDVERKLHLNRIRVRGEAKAVTENVQEIYKILREAENDEHRRNEAELVNKMVHWEYIDKDGKYVPYSEYINVIIERALANKKECAEWEERDGHHYRLIFHAKQEMCIETQVTTTVRRTAKDPLPAHWDPMSDTENLKVVEILPTSLEYLGVETRAKATANGTINTIVKIERIQNRRLYKQYMVAKEDKEKTKPRSADYEKTLWHGTDAETVDKINDSIFNRSYAGKNATVYGQGVYFAVNFEYSAQNTYAKPDNNQVKRVYQCKVFVGESTKGTGDMKEPPLKSPSSRESYDSVVDNLSAPKMFVIFYDAQAYPEYLIYFK